MINSSNKATPAPSEPTKECCMCGDLGLFSHIFRCKTCRFRFQHRYCSNEYPTAEVYRICNWCLSEKDDSSEKTPNSSSSNKTNTNEEDDRSKKKINAGHGSLKSDKKALKVQINQAVIMKKGLPERSPVLAARKRVTTTKGGSGGDMQDKLRRTKSEDISNRGIIRKQIFRNKVRRYKLLHEVSC